MNKERKTRDKKSGYTKIPNELMEILYSGALNYTEARIVTFMARKIYGFHKITDRISNLQIRQALGLGKTTVIETLQRLQLVGIVVLVRRGNSKKRSNEWRLDFTDLTAKLVGIGKLVRFDPRNWSTIGGPTKESNTKERENQKGEQPQAQGLTSDSPNSLSAPTKDWKDSIPSIYDVMRDEEASNK